MAFDPYAAPEGPADARPRVIGWYRAYAASTAALLVAFAVVDLVSFPRTEATAAIGGAVMLVTLATAFAVGARVPYKPWGWSLGLALLALGVVSVLVVVALPLLVAWLKPTTKAAFGRL